MVDKPEQQLKNKALEVQEKGWDQHRDSNWYSDKKWGHTQNPSIDVKIVLSWRLWRFNRCRKNAFLKLPLSD